MVGVCGGCLRGGWMVAPFSGAVLCNNRLKGVLCGKILNGRRDGVVGCRIKY